MFNFIRNDPPEATVLQLVRGDIRHTLAFDSRATAHPEIGPATSQLRDGVANMAEGLARVAPDLSRAGLNKEAVRLADRLIKVPFGLVVESAHKADRLLEAEWARLHQPRFAEGHEPAVRAEKRGWARSLKMPQAIEAAQNDHTLAAAIIEGGPAMSGLPFDVFERIHRDYAIGRLADDLAKHQDFRTQPTADDPIGGKTDFEATRKVAAARLDKLDAERDLLRQVPKMLTGVVDAVATMTEESRQAAFERLNG